MKLSDFVVRFLADRGVRHVFMLPGGGAMHLNDSLGQSDLISYVCTLHEQAAAIAAEAYAKATGSFGCVMVTTGPGATNAITGLVGAWQDSTPCLFISGQVKRSDLSAGRGVRSMGVQEVDIVTMVSSVTKYAVTILDPNSIRYHLEKALYLCQNGRPGPVWIDIPLDVQASTIDEKTLPSYQIPRPTPDNRLVESVAEARRLLAAAERPVLLLGNGVRLSGAAANVPEFVATLDMPVLTTWLGLDLVADDDPLFVGRPGGVAPRGANFAIQNADFLLSVGARLDLVVTAYAPEKLARGAVKVMVDIDPAELAKMGSTIRVPICADAGRFMAEWLSQASGTPPHDCAEWKRRCEDWKRRYPVVLPDHRHAEGLVSLYHFSEVMSEALSPGDLVVSGSSGTGIEIFLLALAVKRGQRILHTTALGAMGFGLPAALGGCVGVDGRRTVCVDGDGGFQLNIQDLATIAGRGLPITFFVLNNGGYASIKNSQRQYFGRIVAADKDSGLYLPDLLRIASAYGIGTARIEDSKDLRSQVSDVLSQPAPLICEVMVLPDEPRAPRVATVQRPDGTMMSRPLEDMWPFLDRAEFMANMIVEPLNED